MWLFQFSTVGEWFFVGGDFVFIFIFSWIFLGYFIIFLFQKDVFKRHLKNNFAFFFSVQEGFLIIASISVFCDNVNFLLQCEF